MRQEKPPEMPFKKQGMYLLSGGLGGIGVELSKYLLKHYDARVLLVGRSPPPEKSEPEAGMESANLISQRKLSLEGFGGEVFYEAAVMLAVFLLFGHWMEMRSIVAASRALDHLASMVPSVAHRLESDGSARDIPVTDLVAGDRILVRPGEQVPIDGTVGAGACLEAARRPLFVTKNGMRAAFLNYAENEFGTAGARSAGTLGGSACAGSSGGAGATRCCWS